MDRADRQKVIEAIQTIDDLDSHTFANVLLCVSDRTACGWTRGIVDKVLLDFSERGNGL